MSEKIVQLNEEIIKGQIKELVRSWSAPGFAMWRVPSGAKCMNMKHLEAALNDVSIAG